MSVQKTLVLFCVLQIIASVSSDTKPLAEGRKKQEDVMTKILPMLAMPFITQTALLPMALMSMKFMLIKSMILGKLAILLAFVTFLRNLLKKPDGVYSHNINILHPPEHEPYIYNKKRRKEDGS